MKKGKQGEGGGRPPKYPTEESLKNEIVSYMLACLQSKQMPSKAGCCLFLDIDKSTYNDYKKKFPHPIKRFENETEATWIQRLAGNSPTGAIFYLKNAFKEDYKDKHETDVTSNGKTINGFNFIRNDSDDKTD